jgi:hypothetical protein
MRKATSWRNLGVFHQRLEDYEEVFADCNVLEAILQLDSLQCKFHIQNNILAFQNQRYDQDLSLGLKSVGKPILFISFLKFPHFLGVNTEH